MTDFSSAAYEGMGPSLLASQPLTVPSKRWQPNENWQAIFTHLESRLAALRQWRWSWWAYWNVLAEFFLARRHKWFVVSNNMIRGRPINDAIIDSTGQLAVNICASGLWTGLTNPARPWFKLALALPWAEEDAEAKEWMEDTEQRIYAILAESNFYETMAQAFQDVTVFGTAPPIIYEDDEDVIRCYLPCAGEYFLAAGSRLSVDTLYREFTFTVAQIVGQFKLENCNAEVRNLWELGRTEIEFVVCHAIEPNFPILGRGKGKSRPIEVLPSSFTWREIYWLKGRKGEQPLSKRGFTEQPFFAMRWSTVSNDPYGRSPCMDALGDTKQIQQETRRKAEFIEKGVRPPMGADPELKNEPASIIPGMITYVNQDTGKKGFWPLFEPNAQWLQGLIQDIATVSERINRALFVDVFMAITRMQGVQPRNELELSMRDLERLQAIGPFINRFGNEAGAPAIKRVLEIAKRRGLLKPMPDSLKGQPLKLEFVSMLTIAQNSAEGVAMKDVLATGGNLSAAAKAAGLPDPLRIIDLDKAMRKYAKTKAFPDSVILTPEQVAELDQARAEGEAQAQVLPTTLAGVQAARTLADTPIEGGNALHALLSGQTGQV